MAPPSPNKTHTQKHNRKGSAREARRTGRGGASVHAGLACTLCGAQPIVGVRHKSISQRGVSVCAPCVGSGAALAMGPFIALGAESGSAPLPPAARALVEFCWHYFRQGERAGEAGGGGGGSGGAAATPSPGAAAAVSAAAASAAAVSAAAASAAARPPGPPSSFNAFNVLMRRAPPPAGLADGGGAGVRTTGLPPLYLQFEGHSVTIVGVERRPRPHQQHLMLQRALPPSAVADAPPPASPSSSSSFAWWGPLWARHDYCLLVLDPSVPVARLEAALSGGGGGPTAWAPLVRRLAAGQTLSRPRAQFQVVRVDRAVRRGGPMRGGEAEAAKVAVAHEWYA